MKRALLWISLISLGVYAQEEKPVCKISNEDFSFKSKSITFDSDAKKMTLNEDASYKDNIIEITGAEQIVLDQASNEILVTGNYDFTIDGAIQFIKRETTAKRLRYKIGEAIAYIE